MRLSAIFIDETGSRDALPGATPELETRLERLLARGRSAHPGFTISDAVFVSHLARCGAPIDRSVADESIHAEDLFLACACLAGEEAAIEVLVRETEADIAGRLRRIDPSADFASDVQQRLWDSLLVGTVASPPRLAMYSGLGPLIGWMGIAMHRIALMMRRHDQAEERARRSILGDAEAAMQDPELALLKQRFGGLFRDATEKALETLTDRERLIFRLHLVDGVTIERIAKTYAVSHSTISRWFAAAREKILAQIQRVLRADLSISEREFESLQRLVVSQLDLSVSMLASRRP